MASAVFEGAGYDKDAEAVRNPAKGTGSDNPR